MIPHTKSFKRLKDEAQTALNFAIVVSYAVPSLKRILQGLAEGEQLPFLPDYFNARPIPTEKVKAHLGHEAGGYYVRFADKASDSIQAHAGNLLAIGDEYDPAGMLRTDLLDVLAGRRAIDAGITEYTQSRLPKIPPPPSCPDRKRAKR